MSIVFDHQSNSIRVEHTKEAYLEAQGAFGPPPYNAVGGAIGQHVSFRHEYAHFSSFLATGLSELQSVIQDFKLSILISVLHRALGGSPKELSVPLIQSGRGSILSSSLVDAVQAAWDQATAIEGYLLGLGSNKPIGELFRFGTPDRLAAEIDSVLFQYNFPRYRKFLKQVMFTTMPAMLQMSASALVRVRLRDDVEMKMSSRSVLEAYAITIEIIAEYIKSVWTSLNVPRQEPKRVPPRIYSVALEAILETILPDRAIFMDEYVYGKAGSDVYWAVALTAYAAMQVPVVEDPQGDAIIMGSLKQLHPALRLHAMIQGLIGGHIPNPLETYSSRQDSRVVMQWLIECHKFIGDPWSIKFAQHISSVVAGMPERYSRPASMHDLSWAARAAFCSEPYEMIGDGGIWLGLLPRFVRTSDDCILVYGDVDVEGDRDQVFAAFIGANALYVLEAMVFGKSWDVCWDKVCGFSPEQKIEAMRLASAFYLHKSGIEYENTPVISLINGFQ